MIIVAEERSFPTNPQLESKEGITFLPIGVFKTSYSENKRPPRQGMLAPNTTQQIVIDKKYRKALKDLGMFEYIIVLYYFDKVDRWTEYGHPPKSEAETGLFSTRSPYRPNPIGLSTIKLDSIDYDKGVLFVEGADAFNNTPVLDIKPYLPFVDKINTTLSKDAKKLLGLDKE